MRILTIIPAALLGSACAYAPPIEHKTLSSPNPTSYVFSSPFPKVLAAMDDLCSKDRPLSDADTPTSRAISRCDRSSEVDVYTRECPSCRRDHPLYTPKFNPDANQDRIVFETRNFDSRSYFVNGKPVSNWCLYVVILQRIDSAKTRVTIEPIDLRAVNGTAHGIHGAIVTHIVNLKPTSIEEYEVLYYLGNRIGESGMPLIQLP